MPRRKLFPLRRCPGLVPIPELDDDVVLIVVTGRERDRGDNSERAPRRRQPTLIGYVTPASPREQASLAADELVA
jgi:hypothetical protein